MADTEQSPITAPLMLRSDQIKKIDELKARRQRVKPGHQAVSRSEIARDALDEGLPKVEEDIAAEESKAQEVPA